MISIRLLVVIVLAACVGCTDADTGTGPEPRPGDCTDPASICVTLHLPADYVGTPKKIIAGLYERLPPPGPPIGVAAIVEQPPITPGTPYTLHAADVMPAGEYYVYVVLYDVAGGNFQPVPNVDYIAETGGARTVGGAAVNLDDLTFALYRGP